MRAPPRVADGVFLFVFFAGAAEEVVVSAPR
jgi:hypothetical protein